MSIPTRPTLSVEALNELTPRSYTWLWQYRLVLGKPALLDGDPEEGKSLLTADLCALLTSGRPFPGDTTSLGPANVIINSEDLAARCVRTMVDGKLLSYWLVPTHELRAAAATDLEPWLAPLRDMYPPRNPLDDLKAQGYTTYRSPEGPDGGVDILAGAGPLGFSSPQLCVQVKSHDAPAESKALNELRGAMQSVHASEGLFVSWSGFKSTAYKQAAQSFFSVRLWTQKELLEALFAHYHALDESLQAELPLKRIWTAAAQEE